MIIRDNPSAFRLFFVMQGSVLPRILGKIGAVALLTALVLLVDAEVTLLPHVSMAALSVFGVALSLFLGFRNNAAYERWWEARKLWGGIIADIRSLGQQMAAFSENREDCRRMLHLAVAFAHLHRGHLRGADTRADAARFIDPEEAERIAARLNPADAVLHRMAALVGEMARAGRIDAYARVALSDRLGQLALTQAGCERVRSTPLPFVYSLLVRRTTYLYCFLLPFALIETTGWFAPLFTAVVAYVFFGLQAVTNELEHPFANVQNGLPLDAMCRIIEVSVAEALGETPPPLMQPRNHLLT
ncbi:bestrophin family protein [Sulfitobacter aestuarii]|uniref:Bestrophin family protein n=1 Tax=Sulfitobacter aestuarii TaxID=2161676 RepID=A0ABW5U5B6_9RHOB